MTEDIFADDKKGQLCKICFGKKLSGCICDRITRYYPGRNQDIPVDDLTEEEWAMYFPE